MSEIINIRFDKSLLESEIHSQNLKVASLNLINFNKRNPEKELIKFEYIKVNDEYTFRRLKTLFIHIIQTAIYLWIGLLLWLETLNGTLNGLNITLKECIAIFSSIITVMVNPK